MPNIDSLPKDPLGKGEQYFIDLAGNIKKGPVGVGYTCYCAPFFKNVEDKLEKDKVALMDHIDAAHDKLDAKITNLEHRTKSHIQHLNDNVKQKLADEKEECRQRVERTRVAREVQADSKIVQLQQWVERRLAARNPTTQHPQVLPRSFLFRGSVRRPKEPPPGHYPLLRSRSEEAISEYREEGESDRDSVYKGLRVLDHPTSMYNIPQTVHDERDAIIYDSPKAMPSLVPGALRCPSPTDHPSRSQSADNRGLVRVSRAQEKRSHSLDARNVIENSEDLSNGKMLGKNEGSPVNIPVRDVLNESASSDLSGGQRGSRSSRGLSGSSKHGSPVVRRLGRFSPAHPSSILRHPDLTAPAETSASPPNRPSPLHHTDLNQAVDNLRVSQSHAANGAIPKTTMRSEDTAHCTRSNEVSQVQQQSQGWSGYSRYDYRNSNPYMHGDLRGRSSHTHQPHVASPLTNPSPTNLATETYIQYPKYPTPPEEGQTAEPYQPQPNDTYHTQNVEAYYGQNAEAYQSHSADTYHTQTAEAHHNQSVETYHAHMAQAQEDYDAATYLDMDRYRIQQAVRRLYDGYLAEGRLEAVRGAAGRNPHEASIEHDSHNDSGYSTRLCTGSQGPSPALSVWGLQPQERRPTIKGLSRSLSTMATHPFTSA